MGMFDYVRCEPALPDDRVAGNPDFQTKSFSCCMCRYTIAEKGRLIFHRDQYEEGPEREVRPGVTFPTYKLVHTEDIDMEYHGDMKFGGAGRDNTYVEYAARFSHGALEWIRPYEELPAIHRIWLTERGQ